MFDRQEFLNAKIQYVSSGLFVSDGKWIHPTRIIDGYELIFVVKGTLLIGAEQTEYILSENETIFLLPGIEHYGLRTSEEDISFYWVHFYFEDGDPAVTAPQNALVTRSSNLHILFRQLIHYANTPRYPVECCNDLLRLAIVEVLLSQSEAVPAGNALINKIQQWIRIHYDKNITLEDIERQFNYNRDYLSRLFKQNFNMGIKQYIDRVKMDRAKEFIVSGHSLSSVADMIGIENYNLFLKKFKYHEGVSPKQFRDAYTSLHLNKK